MNLPTIFPTDFQFEGNRALVFDVKKPLPNATAFCIDAAFNYRKRSHGLELTVGRLPS